MSNDISSTLNKPEQTKETKYNLIATISDDMNKGLNLFLEKTISGGGNKENHNLGTKSQDILSGNQITSQGEKWGQQWATKRGSQNLH